MKSLLLMLSILGHDITRPVPPNVTWMSEEVYVVVPTIPIGFLNVWLMQSVLVRKPVEENRTLYLPPEA